MLVYIPKNTPFPFSVTKKIYTAQDDQVAMRFPILQGESKKAEDCYQLAMARVENLPPKSAGKVHFEVTFTVDHNGIFSFSAVSEDNQVAAQLTIHNEDFCHDAEDLANLMQYAE